MKSFFKELWVGVVCYLNGHEWDWDIMITENRYVCTRCSYEFFQVDERTNTFEKKKVH